MALLELHGIGNGKYKPGGTYPETILNINLETPPGQNIFEYNLQSILPNDTAFRGSSICKGESGSVYIGGYNTETPLKKITEEGDLIWEINLAPNTVNSSNFVGRLTYNENNNLVVCTVAGVGIFVVNGQGELLYNIPNNQGITNLQLFDETFFVSTRTTSQTISNMTYYNIDGTIRNQINQQNFWMASMKDEEIYALNSTGTNNAYKINLQGVRQWQYNLRTAVTGTNPTSSIVFDAQGNVYFATQLTGGSTDTRIAYLDVFKQDTGEIVGKFYRGASGDFFNPNNINFSDLTRPNIQLPYEARGNYYSNGVDYPVMIFNESNYLRMRTINERGDVFSSFSVATSGTNNYPLQPNSVYQHAFLDENKIAYVISNTYVGAWDTKSYYTINK